MSNPSDADVFDSACTSCGACCAPSRATAGDVLYILDVHHPDAGRSHYEGVRRMRRRKHSPMYDPTPPGKQLLQLGTL